MKLRHFDHDGRARFITFCTHKRIPFLTRDKFRRITIDAIREGKAAEGFRVLGYVIMHEHVHVVIVPRIDSELGLIIGEIKLLSAQLIHQVMLAENSKLLSRLTVARDGIERFVCWQRCCYDHNCRSEKAVWEKVNYCHNNPVKRGLVSSADRWR